MGMVDQFVHLYKLNVGFKMISVSESFCNREKGVASTSIGFNWLTQKERRDLRRVCLTDENQAEERGEVDHPAAKPLAVNFPEREA